MTKMRRALIIRTLIKNELKTNYKNNFSQFSAILITQATQKLIKNVYLRPFYHENEQLIKTTNFNS